MIHTNILSTIGNTPLVRLNSFDHKNMMVKLERANPGASVKDRAALNMIEQAEKCGDLKKGMTIVEPTSGNTGVGLAMVAAVKGYKTVFTMPETMTVERRKILQAYGGEIILTQGAKGMNGAITKANELAVDENFFMPQQFENPNNSLAHKSTAEEIWKDTEGKIDILVCATGTGGTISGTGKFLREKNPDLTIIAMEPADSAVISGQKPGPHKIQGTGPGFLPKILTSKIIDKVITVGNEEAFEYTRILAQKEGIFCGVSSGAVLVAMLQIAQDPKNANKNIVGILPDTGERYLSFDVF